MQFVKTYWISLLSGGLALAAIVIMVLGLTSDGVQKEMQDRLKVAEDIDRLARDPKNAACINAELQRRQKFEQEFAAAMEVAERINKRDPLIEGLFPQPAQLEIGYRFQEAYRDKLYELPRAMRAGDLPNEQEVRDESDILLDIERRKQEQERESGAAVKPTEGPIRPAPRIGGGNTGFGPSGGFTGMPGGTGWRPPLTGPMVPGPIGGGNVPVEMARERASIKKARAIRIYATADQARASFHISPLLQSNKPTPKELWHAQVALWVQQDVVQAIAALNDETAKQLNEKDANVTNMPVKRLVSTRILGYVTSTGTSVPFISLAGGAGSGGADAIPPSFTGRKSDDQFDVVRFTVTVIVDRRDLLRLVDALTRVNFYQLVEASYDVLPAEADKKSGYFYGEEPVVQATLDFEGYMARKVYKPLMPAEVKEELGIRDESGK